MADTFNTYSEKKSVWTTGLFYGVSEMSETALSQGIQDGRSTLVTGITQDIENEFINDVVQDGVMAGLGFFTGQAMRVQEEILENAFNKTAVAVTSWYAGRTFLKGKLSGLKGRKLGIFSKILGSNDKKADECRLIADFGKMDISSTSSSKSPIAAHNTLEGKIKQESLEVNKESTRTRMANLKVNGMAQTFKMKLDTSTFSDLDKDLIRTMTGVVTVTDDLINKLNSISSSFSFKDSSGNYVGGNQVMAEMMNFLNTNKIG